MNPNTSKRLSLQTILMFAFTASGILVSIFIITILYNNFKLGLREELRNRLVSITNIAAMQQDGDTLLKVAARDDEYYKIINERNLKIRDSDPDLVFVYTMRKNENGIYFVVDANRPGDENVSDFGQPYLEPGPALEKNFDTMTGTIIEPDFYTDEYDTFLSAYAPIYTASGEKIGVLGVDIAANKIIAKEQKILVKSVLFFLASILVIAVLGYILGGLVAAPLKRLTTTALEIAQGNLQEKAVISTGSKEASLLALSFNAMTEKINDLINSLEQRVTDRTSELQKRATQLQTVSSVARTIASVQDLDALLPDITSLVSEQFGFYHVGIFLVDDANTFAVLHAANSEGGGRMLDRRHQLRLDANSIVGFSISRGEPRIALDVGTDSVYFNNPDLPETRSEMALPLRVGSRVIGALDVQSRQPNAFTQEDISVITTLADQVAIAIENARLFGDSQKALVESRETLDRYVKREWTSFAKQAKHTGYVFDGRQISPLDKEIKLESVKTVTRTGSLSTEGSPSTIAVPIKLRGQTIGTLDVRAKKGQREWKQDEIALLEAAAERAALALENARLVESAQRRASRERAIGEISTKIGAFSDMDAILQAAVEELGRRIGGATEVTIELGEEDKQSIS